MPRRPPGYAEAPGGSLPFATPVEHGFLFSVLGAWGVGALLRVRAREGNDEALYAPGGLTLRLVACAVASFRRAGGLRPPAPRPVASFRSRPPLGQPGRAFALPTARRCLHLHPPRIFAQEGRC